MEKPRILEIGPGRGDFLISLAREQPHIEIAAIEYKKKRFEKLKKRVGSFPNVTLWQGDARLLVPELFPEESLDEAYILFPDPWPKRRHGKHRLFQPTFVQSLATRLKQEGRIFIETDDRVYFDQIQRIFNTIALLKVQPQERGLYPTFYREKWLQEGRSLYSACYQRGR
jgi:tRNA (guanine-N7-)-methyltransferase